MEHSKFLNGGMEIVTDMNGDQTSHLKALQIRKI